MQTATMLKEPEKVVSLLERKETFTNDKIVSLTDRLEKLGMNQASKKLTQAGKLAIAYQHFLYVPQEKIDAFNEKLYKDTLREDKNARQYKKLIDIPLDHYPEVPPDFVLDKIERALDIGCFDHLEVTKVDWIKEVKDPIVFGRINGSSDRFFIAQWDDDIKVEDLLLANFKEE